MTNRDPLGRIAQASDALASAQACLAEAVEQARQEGISWARIGRILGTSRQAAFKRFGRPVDPRTGEPMTALRRDPRPLFGQVFSLIDGGSYGALQSLLDDAAAQVLTRDAVLGVWAGVVANVGNLTGTRDVRVVLPGTRETAPDESLGTLVVEGTLVCEAGDHHGRIAVAHDGFTERVVGLLVLPRAPKEPHPF